MDDITTSFNAPIIAAFTYGSSLMSNIKNSKHSSLIDYILIVEDSREFHSLTMKQYPEHYSFLASMMPPETISFINDSIPAGLYFHPYVSIKKNYHDLTHSPSMIKYGIISLNLALNDLTHWTYFYLAGRLQKPVRWIKFPSNSSLVDAINQNLLSTLSATLLLLKDKEKISLLDLYVKLISLSYDGDIRMKFAEDPSKIIKILTTSTPCVNFTDPSASFDFANRSGMKLVSNDILPSPLSSGNKNLRTSCIFDGLYLNLFDQLGDIKISTHSNYESHFPIQGLNERETNIILYLKDKYISFPKTPSYERHLYSYLPLEIQILVPFSNDKLFSEKLTSCIRKKVLFSSTCQSIKGLFSAGPTKSLNYLFKKISKRLFF